jgi:hypothetical protein
MTSRIAGYLPRPYALTVDVQGQIVASLREGNYVSVACRAAGTTYDTFRHWERRWEDGDPVAQQFADFFMASRKAQALAETEALRRVREGAPGWQGSAWYLERRFSARWGRRATIAVDGPRLLEDLSKLTDEELEAIARGSKRR